MAFGIETSSHTPATSFVSGLYSLPLSSTPHIVEEALVARERGQPIHHVHDSKVTSGTRYATSASCEYIKLPSVFSAPFRCHLPQTTMVSLHQTTQLTSLLIKNTIPQHFTNMLAKSSILALVVSFLPALLQIYRAIALV
jgi:hypothetical protein